MGDKGCVTGWKIGCDHLNNELFAPYSDHHLNNELIVRYSGHGLNSELKVRYSGHENHPTYYLA